MPSRKTETRRKQRRAAMDGAYAAALADFKRHGFLLSVEHPKSSSFEVKTKDGQRFFVFPRRGEWGVIGPGKQLRRRGTAAEALAHARAAHAVEHRWDHEHIAVTIFADAGYHYSTGAAGWGAWIKADGAQALSKCGPIRELLGSSVEAEMRALANGLCLAKTAGLLTRGVGVMLQSDCHTALCWVLGWAPRSADRPAKDGLACRKSPRKTVPQRESRGLAVFLELVEEFELIVFTRHVRGHQPGADRQWVNRLCDSLAGQGLRVRRQTATAPYPGREARFNRDQGVST